MPRRPKQKKTDYPGYAARFTPKRFKPTPRKPFPWPKGMRSKTTKVREMHPEGATRIPVSGVKTISRIYKRPGVIPPRAQMVLRRLTKRRGGSGGARKR